MSQASLAMLDLARKLFAIEVGHGETKVQDIECVVRVCERLRHPLTKFAGPVGYASLLSRALSLSQAELPQLKSITLQADGSLSCLHPTHLTLVQPNQQNVENAGIYVVAHLLGLLVIFIGEPLMVALLSEAWPSESFDKVHLRSEVKS